MGSHRPIPAQPLSDRKARSYEQSDRARKNEDDEKRSAWRSVVRNRPARELEYWTSQRHPQHEGLAKRWTWALDGKIFAKSPVFVDCTAGTGAYKGPERRY